MNQFMRRGLGVCLCVAISQGAVAATLSVRAGGDLQAAINAAKPGDTILLQAGATFSGSFKLPAKGGTSYITIRSSASDTQLPPAGTRISPAYAALLPKLRATTAGPAIRTSAGASYWRILFVEFFPSSSSSAATLVELGSSGSSQSTLSSVPHHFTIDRSYLHGDPGYGQRRGIALNSAHTQVINSYFANFKKVTQDTQAIMGWNGPGPYLIQNNYIEGAAENIMFGGADPNITNLVPSNITIRRNLIRKPLKWRAENWTIKNLIELKNAQNVVIEGNVIENNWVAGQQGYAIVLSPRNQSGTAPWTVVKNVVIRNNIIRHVAGGFNISGYDSNATSQQTRDIAIRNNLIYDVSRSYGSNGGAGAPGRLALIGSGPGDIVFDHNTVDNNGTSTIFLYGGNSRTGTKIYGFELTDNLLRDNQYGVFGDGYGEGIAAFNAYTPNAVVLRNTFAGGSPKTYPSSNYFPTLLTWLADFVSVTSADYRLRSASLSNEAGADGKDLGVDFAALNAAMN